MIARALLAALLIAAPAAAQQAARSPRQAAPVDLTGYWVSFVTEDWRFRMLTPPKGDYRGVPLTPEGRKVADAWNPAADAAAGEACRAYGAGGIMRVPGRLHITWQDDTTLRIDTDAGTQTRLLRFAPAAGAPPMPSWQGQSAARWDVPGRALTAVTTRLRPGYLRRNGVPYSENATVTEHFDVAPHPQGGQLLVVTTVVEDPRYLQRSFVVSTHFKKEADGSRWSPTPCTAPW